MNRSIALFLSVGWMSCIPSTNYNTVVAASFGFEEVFPSSSNTFILRFLAERAAEDAVRCLGSGVSNDAFSSDDPKQNIRVEFTGNVGTDATGSPDSPPMFPDQIGGATPIRAGRAEYFPMPVSEFCDYATAAWADVRVTVRSDESPPRDSVRFSWSGSVSMEIAQKDAERAPKQHLRVLRWMTDAWVEIPSNPSIEGPSKPVLPVY
jgi:hypothetical protein